MYLSPVYTAAPAVADERVGTVFAALDSLGIPYIRFEHDATATMEDCAAVGEAMLVREAARKQQEGLTIEELAAWVEENRLKICHWFTVDSFDHLKHGGRVSAAAAAVGTMLQIKPLLHVDEEGKLRVAEKPRGRKQAIRTQVAHMKEGWTPEMGKLVVIGHGDCPDDVEQLRQAVLKEFPDADIRVAYIGPVIGAHTGPGMLALIYWGMNR